MRRSLPMLAIAGLLLCGALIAGCASTNYGTGTTAPTSSPAAVQTTSAAGGGGQVTTTAIPATTTATTPTLTATATIAASATGTETVERTVSVEITARNIAFDTSTITVPAGSKVTVTLQNMDAGVPHTFSVYKDSTTSTAIFRGERVTGPATRTYTFTAPSTPGTYYFQCDVHPMQMNGQFIVA